MSLAYPTSWSHAADTSADRSGSPEPNFWAAEAIPRTWARRWGDCASSRWPNSAASFGDHPVTTRTLRGPPSTGDALPACRAAGDPGVGGRNWSVPINLVLGITSIRLVARSPGTSGTIPLVSDGTVTEPDGSSALVWWTWRSTGFDQWPSLKRYKRPIVSTLIPPPSSGFEFGRGALTCSSPSRPSGGWPPRRRGRTPT